MKNRVHVLNIGEYYTLRYHALISRLLAVLFISLILKHRNLLINRTAERLAEGQKLLSSGLSDLIVLYLDLADHLFYWPCRMQFLLCKKRKIADWEEEEFYAIFRFQKN